uniref:DUF4283 domain-containing protein n=1 Tax=Populus trichocarpa TaxID=3694 RepID=B9HD93_POPTR
MKLGRRFGVVTLQSHQLQDILKERLNLIWFNSYKLRANMVRFSKPSINLSMGKQEALSKTNQTWTRVRDGRNYVDLVKTPERGKTLEARTMIHETKDEDVEWLHIILVCVIAFDVDYTALKTKLMQSGLGMIGLKFLGAKQVILTFNTYDSMIEATKLEAVECEIIFTEIRPWLRADRAIDTFTWVNISGLPLAAWNKDCITNILAAQGKVIGYDLSSVGHSYISGVHVLNATPSTDSCMTELN